ncbi:AP-4 complex accessory subunit tepsin [Lingula anatina]|uniref:AP-4 complex accessory subunit tepsin n=1 Tax=Lingula anatina TaxID=7574 RepID=A0A1S3JDK8_LINAN|nr:AP-4 complex accessory subunit tepsin [Lingula anatina]|eukprot:XP_013408418.1 AP-4 complex accessory subunit tepsin [Lingula anatina]
MVEEGKQISSFLDKISFLKEYPLLEKATGDNEQPTAGYMFKEINNISYESGSHCQSLLSYLVDKLDSKSYHVKLKVIKIMRYLVDNGHHEFVEGLRKKSRGIKEAESFGGPPDPLHGNTPYETVRKAAKELSQQLYNETGMQHRTRPPEGRIEAVGISGSTSSGLEGFGNSPNKTTKSLGSTVVSGLRSLADSLSDHSETTARTKAADFKRPFDQYTRVRLQEAISPGKSQENSITDTHRGTQKARVKGRPGGGWDDDEEEEVVSSGSGSQLGTSSSWNLHDRSTGHSAGSNELSDRMNSLTVSDDWSSEVQAVNQFTSKSAKLLPSRREIQEFLKRCQILNCEKITDLLNDALTSTNDVMLMRCLLLLEAMMRSDLFTVDQLTLVFSKNLIMLYQHKEGAVQAKARKIIRQMEKLSKHSEVFSVIPATSSTNTIPMSSSSTNTMNKSSTGTSIDGLAQSSDTSLVAPFYVSTDTLLINNSGEEVDSGLDNGSETNTDSFADLLDNVPSLLETEGERGEDS